MSHCLCTFASFRGSPLSGHIYPLPFHCWFRAHACLRPSLGLAESWLAWAASILFYHRPAGVNYQHPALTVWEAGRSKVLVVSVPVQMPLPGTQTAIFLLCPPRAERERALVSSSLNMVTNPTMRVPLSCPCLNITTLRSPHFQTRWGLEFPQRNFVDTHSASNIFISPCLRHHQVWIRAT